MCAQLCGCGACDSCMCTRDVLHFAIWFSGHCCDENFGQGTDLFIVARQDGQDLVHELRSVKRGVLGFGDMVGERRIVLGVQETQIDRGEFSSHTHQIRDQNRQQGKCMCSNWVRGGMCGSCFDEN